MEGKKMADASDPQEATANINLATLQQLIISAIKGGNQEYEERLQARIQAQLKEVQEKHQASIQAQLKEIQEQIQREHKRMIADVEEKVDKVLEHLALSANKTATYATAARGNHAIPPIKIQYRTTPTNQTITPKQVMDPRANSDIKVRIKNAVAVERIRCTTAPLLVANINKALEGKTGGRAIAARQMWSGDISVATANVISKAELMKHQGWLQTLDRDAEIITPAYQVLVHGVRVKAVDMEKPEVTFEALRAENIDVMQEGGIKRITWAKHALNERQTHTSLVVSFDKASTANEVIRKGLAFECRIHECELWDTRCRRRQCYQCHQYGHMAPTCRRAQKCAFCTGPHDVKECGVKGDKTKLKCAACGEDGHPAWDRSCKLNKKEEERIKAALEVRPVLYNEETGINKSMNRNLSSKSMRQASQSPPPLSTTGQSRLGGTMNDTIPAKRGRPKGKACSPVKKTMTPQEDPNTSQRSPDTTLQDTITPNLQITRTGRTITPSTKALDQEGWREVFHRKRKAATSQDSGEPSLSSKRISREPLTERDGNLKPRTPQTTTPMEEDEL